MPQEFYNTYIMAPISYVTQIEMNRGCCLQITAAIMATIQCHGHKVGRVQNALHNQPLVLFEKKSPTLKAVRQQMGVRDRHFIVWTEVVFVRVVFRSRKNETIYPNP